MTKRLLYVVGIGAMFIAGCGGGTTSPTDATQMPQAGVLSGVDGLPVVNATLSGSGDGLSVTAPGFLTLDTSDRGRAIHLWPNDARLTLRDTFHYVYGGNEFNSLTRLGDSTLIVSVVPHGQLVTDQMAADAVAEGIAKDNTLLAEAGVNIRFALGKPGQVKADIFIDPSDPVFADPKNRPGAGVYNSRHGNMLIGARIVIYDLEQARVAITTQHELVHVVGLGHSVHQGPMMSGPELYNHQEFTELDADFVRLLYIRQPGTRLSYTDVRENDRSALRASQKQDEKTITYVIVCGLGDR